MRFPKIVKHKSGQARVRIKGKDHYIGIYGTPEAEAAYKQLIAKLISGAPEPPSPGEAITVADVVAAFLVHAEKTLPATSDEPRQHGYSSKPLLDLFGPEPAASFSPKKLKLVQAEMVRRGLARNTVNRNTNRIRTLFKWAESEELVPEGKTHALETVSPIPKTYPGVKNTPPVRPSSRKDLDLVLAQMRPRSPMAAAMLELQWLAGMRSCEIRIVRTCDIDRTRDIWLYRPEHAKTDHLDDHAPRVIPLGQECQRILTPYLNEEKPEAYVFPSRRASHYTKCGYCTVISKACERAGVKLTAYQGRHATKRRITRAAGIDAARAVLGHSSIEMTLDYAAEQDVELAIEVARKLG